jgi:uncharacterized protein YutE (UPF0331/DUF86 family)
MNPRPFHPPAVRRRLRVIRQMLDDLESMGEFSLDRLQTDRVGRLAAERILTQVVDLAASINTHITVATLNRAPESNSDSFALVARIGAIDPGLARQLVPSVKFRNILIHDYLVVDDEKFLTAIKLAPEQYGRYVRQVASWLIDRINEDQKRSGGR